MSWECRLSLITGVNAIPRSAQVAVTGTVSASQETPTPFAVLPVKTKGGVTTAAPPSAAIQAPDGIAGWILQGNPTALIALKIARVAVWPASVSWGQGTMLAGLGAKLVTPVRRTILAQSLPEQTHVTVFAEVRVAALRSFASVAHAVSAIRHCGVRAMFAAIEPRVPGIRGIATMPAVLAASRVHPIKGA